MKKINFLLLVFLMAFGMTSNEANAQSKEEIVSIVQSSAMTAARDLMGKVSPNTGKNPKYDVDYSTIDYNSRTNELSCNVTLSWDAKKYMLLGSYNTCQAWGTLYVNLSDSSVSFVAEGENNWFKECASSHWIDRLAKGLNIGR